VDQENNNNGPGLTKARHAAKGLLKSAKIKTVPIEIKRIIGTVKESYDVTVKGVPNDMFSGKGDAMTQVRDDCIFIIYNESKPVVRKRFSVAHELGHLYIGHLHGNSSSDLNSQNFDEIEANTFAAYLLMPPDLLRKDIKSGIKLPEDLAKKYHVSVDAMWLQLRITNLYKIL
jgi:Zn-dependent peptidase ImmA (M78 family)